ncbi:MAG: thioesterase family protein [Alphaproteobacteria bacterium]
MTVTDEELRGMHTNTISIPVEWGHCDPAKIVFYPNYFVWFDHGTRHLFDSVGVGYDVMLDEYKIVGLPLVDAHAKFMSPSQFGDVLEITSQVSEWRRRTIVVTHEVTNAGTPAVRGEEIRIWASADTDRPGKLITADIPADFRARFEAGGG